MNNHKVTDVDLGTIHRTLFSAGFVVTNFSRKPSYIAFHAFRSDEFGVKANYLIAFCDGEMFIPTDCKALQRSTYAEILNVDEQEVNVNIYDFVENEQKSFQFSKPQLEDSKTELHRILNLIQNLEKESN